jgi:thiol-disulfide isomerase/thioredoxin
MVSLVFSFSVLSAVADDDKSKIASLDDAKTVADVNNYVAQNTAELNKIKPKTGEEFVKKARDKGNLLVSSGDKIIAITDNKSEQDRGFELKISGLKELILAERFTPAQKNEPSTTEYQNELEDLLVKLEKEGRSPLVTNGERYTQFATASSELRSNFSAEKFNDFVKKSKEWAVKKPVNFEPLRPLFRVLDVASSPAAKVVDSQIADKTLADLITFIDSDEFASTGADKNAARERLKSHASIVDRRGRYSQFLIDANSLREEFNADKFGEFVKEAKKWALSPLNFKPVQPLLKVIEVAAAEVPRGDSQIVDKVLDDLTTFVNSGEFDLPEKEKIATIDQLKGYTLRIVGKKPEIYGKTLDDKDFNWEALRGKYVLVKFTASWCGPCKGEIPGMLSAYEKYHDKGLEIVSIYVWDKLDATKKIVADEKLPWIILSEELTEKSEQPLQSKKFAITGVPTMFLVDTDGKIIFTEARGEKLQKKLQELFKE